MSLLLDSLLKHLGDVGGENLCATKLPQVQARLRALSRAQQEQLRDEIAPLLDRDHRSYGAYQILNQYLCHLLSEAAPPTAEQQALATDVKRIHHSGGWNEKDCLSVEEVGERIARRTAQFLSDADLPCESK